MGNNVELLVTLLYRLRMG